MEMSQFGSKLRKLRKSRGLTLKEMARALGYATHSYLSEVEMGRKVPTALFTLKVARYFNVPTDILMKDEYDIPGADTPKPGSTNPVFADRSPTDKEFEKFRLIFSTYQDGTGMLARPDGSTLPGWRDFERSVACAFGGVATENKGIYDVLIPYSQEHFIGISCKMRKTLKEVRKRQRVTVEVSNALGTFWDALKLQGITEENISDFPREAAERLFETIRGWHIAVGTESGGNILTEKSYYLVLQWDDKELSYQMFLFPLLFPNWTLFEWKCRGRRLIGENADGVMFEWYYHSGGQFKYYPPVGKSLWQSREFKLEPLPDFIEVGVIKKARSYFPAQWQALG